MSRSPHPLPSVIAGLLLVGCEPMEPSGNPFAPVAVQAVAVAAGEGPAGDPRFAEFDEPVSYSSEELREMAGGEEEAPGDAAGARADASSSTRATTASSTEAPPTAAGSAPFTAATATLAPTTMALPSAPLGWAVRLVSTVPAAQPPRAILGLPDGREVVVTPGSMVPEVGLVVLAIGPQAVQLARVQPVGDHATVDAFNLTPLY